MRRNLPGKWLFHRELPAHRIGIHQRNRILPGITSSLTRNLPEEGLFSRELPAQGRGIHRRNKNPPESISSMMRNPPEEEFPQENTSSFMLIQTGKLKMRGKSSEREQFQDQPLKAKSEKIAVKRCEMKRKNIFLVSQKQVKIKRNKAHIAGRLNPDQDPEARAKPPQFIWQMWGGGAKPRLPGLTRSLGVLRCGP
jgi:hypothetical protein